MLKALLPAPLKTALKRTLYSGSKYECPFCRARLRTLLPFGQHRAAYQKHGVPASGLRPEAVCPVCFSLDRERLVYLYLLHRTDLFRKPHRLLHAAPEHCLSETMRSAPGIDYLAVDLEPRGGTVKMDLTAIGYPPASFDAVVVCHVLEHIPDDAAAMREIFRVLKPGGWAVLQVPVSASLERTYEDFSITDGKGREEAFGQHDHVRLYGRDYKQRLERAGFRVEVFRWEDGGEAFGAPGNRFCLNINENVYAAYKPA